MPAPLRVGVVCGLDFEADIVLRRARYEGLADVVLARAGFGRLQARAAAEGLLTEGVAALLSFGLAGGLSPAVSCGQTIIPSAIVSEILPRLPCCLKWTARLRAALASGLEGEIAHATTIMTAPSQKAALFSSTRGLATDMESYGVAEAACAAGAPFAALRVVADTADDDVPAIAAQAISSDGTFQLFSTLGRVLRNPAQIPALLRLGQRAGRAKRVLEAASGQATAKVFYAEG